MAPECRIVYVDNDPWSLVHARALVASTPEGATHYLDADLPDTDTVLGQAARTLEFTQPTALMVMGTIEHIMDTREAYAIINRLLKSLVSGSYLVLYHPPPTTSTAKTCQLWEPARGGPHQP